MDWLSVGSAIGAGLASLFIAVMANRSAVRKAKIENDAKVQEAKELVEKKIDKVSDELTRDLALEKDKYEIAMQKWTECETKSIAHTVEIDRVKRELVVLREERNTTQIMAAIEENTVISRNALAKADEAYKEAERLGLKVSSGSKLPEGKANTDQTLTGTVTGTVKPSASK